MMKKPAVVCIVRSFWCANIIYVMFTYLHISCFHIAIGSVWVQDKGFFLVKKTWVLKLATYKCVSPIKNPFFLTVHTIPHPGFRASAISPIEQQIDVV